MMSLLHRIQLEHLPWRVHNFPQHEAWHPLIGMQEELGELSHAFLKLTQNIRTEEDHQAAMHDAVGDLMIYLIDFCNCTNIDVEVALARTWDKVKRRDWQANRSGEDKPK